MSSDLESKTSNGTQKLSDSSSLTEASTKTAKASDDSTARTASIAEQPMPTAARYPTNSQLPLVVVDGDGDGSPKTESPTSVASSDGKSESGPAGGANDEDFKKILTPKSVLTFECRCKLYRYEKISKQNKERGIGTFKLLHYPDSNAYRCLMQRDQVQKVCADFPLFHDIKITQLADTPNVYQWACKDFSEDFCCGYGADTVFFARFKDEDIAAKFARALDRAAKSLPKTQVTSSTVGLPVFLRESATSPESPPPPESATKNPLMPCTATAPKRKRSGSPPSDHHSPPPPPQPLPSSSTTLSMANTTTLVLAADSSSVHVGTLVAATSSTDCRRTGQNDAKPTMAPEFSSIRASVFGSNRIDVGGAGGKRGKFDELVTVKTIAMTQKISPDENETATSATVAEENVTPEGPSKSTTEMMAKNSITEEPLLESVDGEEQEREEAGAGNAVARTSTISNSTKRVFGSSILQSIGTKRTISFAQFSTDKNHGFLSYSSSGTSTSTNHTESAKEEKQDT